MCDFVTVTMVLRKSASYRLPIGFTITLRCSYGENPAPAPAPAGFAIRNPANPAEPDFEKANPVQP